MKDREELYRDRFINEQIGQASGFPMPPEYISVKAKKDHLRTFSSTCLTIEGGETPDLSRFKRRYEIGYFGPLFGRLPIKLRNNKDAAEYKHVVLGFILLKCISDAFQERHELDSR